MNYSTVILYDACIEASSSINVTLLTTYPFRIHIWSCLKEILYIQWFFRFWSVNLNFFDYLFLTVHRSWPFAWAFSTVPWALSTVCDLFKNRITHETFRNGQEPWTFKRLQNYVHGALKFTLQKRKIHYIFLLRQSC